VSALERRPVTSPVDFVINAPAPVVPAPSRREREKAPAKPRPVKPSAPRQVNLALPASLVERLRAYRASTKRPGVRPTPNATILLTAVETNLPDLSKHFAPVTVTGMFGPTVTRASLPREEPLVQTTFVMTESQHATLAGVQRDAGAPSLAAYAAEALRRYLP